MEDWKDIKVEENTSKPQNGGSGLMDIFAMLVMQNTFLNSFEENNTASLLLDAVKCNDSSKIQELATILGVGEDGIKQGVENIKKVIKAQAEKNGMSVDILLDSLITCRA